MRGVNTVKRGEEGMVAIIVATIVMVVMTLITLGFARLMQREQRQALDQSLSTQAFYAAESGVNDVVSYIQDPTHAPVSKPNCDVSASNGTPFTNGTISSNLSASYSCLIINPTPSTLVYSPGRITADTSTTVPIKSSTGATISDVKLAWDPYPAISTPTLNNSICSVLPVSLPALSAWPVTTPGMMRVDLVPVAAGSFTRDSLANGMLSLYLYPAGACGTSLATLGVTSTGSIVFVNCTSGTGARLCEATIKTGATPAPAYYLRMRSLYHNSSVTVRIFNLATQLNLVGAQTEVDSTGKVNDVIRRIQVRVPNNKSYPAPEFVLQSMDSVCKQLAVAPPSSVFGLSYVVGGTDTPGSCNY